MDMEDSLLQEFLQESREHLASIETDLLAMEAAGANIDEALVNKVFRAAHSIKGGAGFFGLEVIQELAHKTENALDLIRARKMAPLPEVVNILLLAFDRLRELINNAATSNEMEIDELVISLVGMTTSYLPEEEKKTVTTRVDVRVSGETRIETTQYDLKRAREHGKRVYLLDIDLLHDVHRAGRTPWEVFKQLWRDGEILECSWDLAAVGTLDDEGADVIPFQLLYATGLASDEIATRVGSPRERIHEVSEGTHDQVDTVVVSAQHDKVSAQAAIPTQVPERPQTVSPSTGDNTVRVGIGLLEQLMNLASEMVLSRNELMEALASGDARAIHASGQRINLVTSELQEAVMMTRMQPVGNVLNKFPRVVRDLALAMGKEIELVITGRDVEMDKKIIEGLSDPLTHMVRNSVDHGIEPAEARLHAGKKAVGTIAIRAYHEAGQIVIEVSDDGKGLDAAVLATAAMNKGLVSHDQIRTMSEQEKRALIFLPGFSTAEKVSDLSGRGVGMDVVKTNLDKLGGKVEIDSEVGKGTTFRIKLPLTLAIVPSLLVSVAEERFAIPQINVMELIRISPEHIRQRIEVIGSAEVLILRGQIIPLIRLDDALGIERTYRDPETGIRVAERREGLADRRSPHHADDEGRGGAHPDPARFVERQPGDRRQSPASDLNIVVVNAGTLRYGLVVERLHDTIEIVVKPLGRHLQALREYAGTTILGDGCVALILDVAGLAAVANMTSLAGTTRAQTLVEEAKHERLEDQQSFLLFHNAPDEHCAVPLELVRRVEQVSHEQIEGIGGRRTMQYRGNSLPLMALQDVASVKPLTDEQSYAVIVFDVSGHEVGLLAAMPVDAVEATVRVDQTTLRQRGIMGSTLLKGHTTLIVDIFELIEAALPDWAPTVLNASAGETILLAEDSDFFRNQVRKFIESEGYRVLTAEDGEKAWELLKQHASEVRMLVTDIEMPQMNGLELTRLVRGDPQFSELPIVALTSLASEEDVARGKAAGVDDYQIKMDKQRLLEGVRRLLLGRGA